MKNKAFTLIELLVVIAIIALLVSILLPSLEKAKELAKEVVCKSNIRSTYMAIMLYSEEYDGDGPPAATGNWGIPFWEQYLMPYADYGASLFYCPLESVEYPQSWIDIYNKSWQKANLSLGECVGRRSYTANKNFIDATKYLVNSSVVHYKVTGEGIDKPADKMLFFESASSFPGVRYWSEFVAYEPYFKYVHKEGMHIMFLDGHLDLWSEEEIFENSGPGDF